MMHRTPPNNLRAALSIILNLESTCEIWHDRWNLTKLMMRKFCHVKYFQKLPIASVCTENASAAFRIARFSTEGTLSPKENSFSQPLSSEASRPSSSETREKFTRKLTTHKIDMAHKLHRWWDCDKDTGKRLVWNWILTASQPHRDTSVQSSSGISKVISHV